MGYWGFEAKLATTICSVFISVATGLACMPATETITPTDCCAASGFDAWKPVTGQVVTL